MSETITDHELQELKKMSKPRTPEQTHTTLSIVNIARIVTTIESQKEEINRVCAGNEMHVNKIIKQSEELESLKAITELAVKGLNMELDVAIARQRVHGIKRLETIFKEIEVLQNAQT